MGLMGKEKNLAAQLQDSQARVVELEGQLTDARPLRMPRDSKADARPMVLEIAPSRFRVAPSTPPIPICSTMRQ